MSSSVPTDRGGHGLHRLYVLRNSNVRSGRFLLRHKRICNPMHRVDLILINNPKQITFDYYFSSLSPVSTREEHYILQIFLVASLHLVFNQQVEDRESTKRGVDKRFDVSFSSCSTLL